MPTLADLTRRLNSPPRRHLPALILMTDRHRLDDPAAAIARLPAGSAVILRHYGIPNREALARRLLSLCRRRRIRLLIAGDGALAARIGADGVHFPEAMARRGPGRWRRPGWLITVAAHSFRAIRQAKALGADAALLSPVFSTPSHPGGRVLGALRFAALCRRAPLADYALGGVTAHTARRLAGSTAIGFAAIAGLAGGSPRLPHDLDAAG